MKDIRNYIVHNGSGELEETDFEAKWITLESAILKYANTVGTCIELMFRRTINELKEKSHSDLQEMIKKHCEKFMQEINTTQTSTTTIIQDYIKTSVQTLEKSLETNTTELQEHFTAEQSRWAEKHEEQNNNLHKKVYEKLEKVEEKQEKGLGELTENIRNLEARIVLLEKRIRSLTPMNGQDLEHEGHKIIMDIELNSTELDEAKTINRLIATSDNSSENEFKLESAEQKCILLNMSSNPMIFENRESLHTAIRLLIERVIVAGEIDTTQKTTMDVSLTITSTINNEQRRILYSMLSKYGVVYQRSSDLDVGPPVHDCLEIDIENLRLLDVTNVQDITTETKGQNIRMDIELKSTELDETKTIARLLSTDDKNSENEFKLVNAKQKCILLNMSSKPKLFEDEESLHTAIQLLIKRVIVAADIDTTQKTKIGVTLTFTSAITNEQRRMAYSMLSKYGVIYQRNSDLDVVDCVEFGNKIPNESESSNFEVFHSEINAIDMQSCTDQSLLETKHISPYDIKKETLECTQDLTEAEYSYTIKDNKKNVTDELDEMSVNNLLNDEDFDEELKFTPKDVDGMIQNIEIFSDVDNSEKFIEKVRKMYSEERRIVMIGKTGSGKSTTANSILGINQFDAKSSMRAVTTYWSYGKTKINDRHTCVVDAPGVFDISSSEELIQNEIAQCIRLTAPGPHAVIIVVTVDRRFTYEEEAAVDHFVSHFGQDMMNYVILLFTKVDELKRQGRPFSEFIHTAPPNLKELIRKCGKRCIPFDNTDKTTIKQQVSCLFKCIDEMIEKNGGSYYTNDMYEKATQAIFEKIKQEQDKIEEQKRKEKEAIDKEVAKKVDLELKNYKKKIEEIMSEKFNLDKDSRVQMAKMAEDIQRVQADLEKNETAYKSTQKKLQRQEDEYTKQSEGSDKDEEFIKTLESSIKNTNEQLERQTKNQNDLKERRGQLLSAIEIEKKTARNMILEKNKKMEQERENVLTEQNKLFKDQTGMYQKLVDQTAERLRQAAEAPRNEDQLGEIRRLWKWPY